MGAVTHDRAVNEWTYNNQVAKNMQVLAAIYGHVVTVYNYYPTMSYVARITREEPHDVALELHFNSAGPKAHGTETLYWHRSRNGQKLAQFVNDGVVASFKTRNRGAKKLIPGMRGVSFVRDTKPPAIICEPFFGSNVDDWRKFRDAQNQLAHAYLAGLQNYACFKKS